ncbi:TetR family transcriptional regulator [Paracoccus caeni]|uniref:TetR family transcriptional regulator n=1 Tax=Paracoccus caeni TaxID=657651 RepID=A0A934VUP8_9RHOB|nr:TetR/AcrR family transcriptional regulator [Paracoccus caeni]MBK4216046.1 TetR family transcriptional regulator [Paracoccus caeni]
MAKAEQAGLPGEGLRERKRRETAQRITDAGIALFIARGYEATTLDDIAEKAGISRRSFFSYFKSKDDILLSLQSGTGKMLVAALHDEPVEKPPLTAMRDAVIRVCAPFPMDEMMAMDRLMRSSESVQARKQASYIEHEKLLFEALRQKWPDPAREVSLRLLAMLSIGTIRLSLDEMSRTGGARPLTDLLAQYFDALDGTL